MRRFLVILLGCLVVGDVSAQETIIHDANAEVRHVSGYHGIRVSNAFDLYLSQGSEETVAVSARDSVLRTYIRTEVVDGILRIWLDEKRWKRLGTRLGNNKLKAYVSFTTLDEITASGASDVYVDGIIGGDKLDLDLSGASGFKGAVKVGTLEVEQSGASNSHVTGIVSGQAVIRTSGGSELNGYDLMIQDCDAHASGASNIYITVSKGLTADASGASSIFYKGEGVLRESHSSGASSVGHKS